MERIKRSIPNLLPVLGLIVVLVLFSIIAGSRFFSSRNFALILNQSYTVMMAAVGVTMIYAHGGIDFSVGAVLGLAEMVAAMVYSRFGAPVLLIVFTVLCAGCCGFITGAITVKLQVPPFIASLCMQLACRGVVNTILQGNTIGVTDLQPPDWEIKLPVIIIVALIVFIILGYTKTGKYNKAIGENIKAARISGINVNKHRIIAYAMSGVILGIAAYFDLLRNGVMSTTVGYGLEMNVIIAIVLGGISLSGGYGTKVYSAILGGLIITILSNGLMIVGVPINYSGIIQGIIFLLVVIVTYKREKQGLLPR